MENTDVTDKLSYKERKLARKKEQKAKRREQQRLLKEQELEGDVEVEDALEVEMKGINTSFLYFGIWRSYFVWHVEDRDLGGANFLHYGEAKTWNVVPPAYGHSFKKLVNEK